VTATPRAIYERPVFARTRRLCLALPETLERSAWGHPTFRAGRKTFCTFESFHGRPSIAFRLPPGEVRKHLRRRQFFETPYGRGLWVSLWVDAAANHDTIATLVDRSYRTVALRRMINALGASIGRRRG
jgi:predicted DNA-binding protein (MmcQ/YjbR family)